jgi:hypothetical protein
MADVSTQWKQDRLRLKTLVKKGLSGIQATFVYVLIAHMRGKLHMHWHRKRHGGWRMGFEGRVMEHNEKDGWFCPGARIRNRDDQLKWLKQHLAHEISLFHGMDELVQRILEGYPTEESAEQPAQAQAAM